MCFPHVADRHRRHRTIKAVADPWVILKCSELFWIEASVLALAIVKNEHFFTIAAL
jgi:hypothetical protein